MPFVSGFPLDLIELRNPANMKATVSRDWQQIQAHRAAPATLSAFNPALIALDAISARLGTLAARPRQFPLGLPDEAPAVP